jgi:D-alanyl-D-alanine carboxypeptidase
MRRPRVFLLAAAGLADVAAGPGFTSISLTSADADRQLILDGTVFDLGRDLLHQAPVPPSAAFGPAQQAVFCD